MDQIEPGREPEEPDNAEQAFEALRAEVAALRHGIELVYRQGQEAEGGAGGPDYSPTLGKMEQALQGIGAWLETIERKPALPMTPESLGADINRVARVTVNVVSHPFLQGMAEARGAVRELQALIGRVREQREQRRWLWAAGAIGVLGGVVLWVTLAALLPWGAGTWLAALPLAGGDQWRAGEILMQSANPASWERMVRLYKACWQDSTTERCEAALAAKVRASLACQIREHRDFRGDHAAAG